MNNPQRIATITKALALTREHRAKSPDDWPLQSVENQLLYILALENGQETDRQRLPTLNLGVIASREISTYDDDLAGLLYEVAGYANKMDE